MSEGTAVHGLSQMVARTQAFCKLIARRENVLIRMAWTGAAPLAGTMEALLRERDELESQIEQLRRSPGYFPLPDPSLDHRACMLEADQLRSQNMQLRKVKDRLWAQNADLARDIRALKGSKHPVHKPKRGRTVHQLRITEIRAQMESLLGWEVGVMGKTATQVRLSRPALEKALSMLREADECRTMHQLQTPVREATA